MKGKTRKRYCQPPKDEGAMTKTTSPSSGDTAGVKWRWGLLLLSVSLSVLGGYWFILPAYASGQDILAGTTATLDTTLRGTGRHYLYLAEGITALIAYIRSKNVVLLGGIVVVAIFLNVLLKVADMPVN